MNETRSEEYESLAAIAALAGGLGEKWLAEQTQRREPITAKAIERLRKEYGPVAARWLLEFAAARGKAVEKFGEGRWLSTQRGIQQATDQYTAAYKAAKFPSGEVIADLCCGVGGDAMALARRGPTLAADLDPHIATMAAANLMEKSSTATDDRRAGPDAIVAAIDVERLLPLPARGFVHIDPDRRPGGRRTIDPARYQPSLPTVERAIKNARGAAVKLAPATVVPQEWENRCAREWISFRGSVRQQVAWFAELCEEVSPGICRATRLLSDGSFTSFAVQSKQRGGAVASTQALGSFIADFDPAVRAAGLSVSLAGTLGMQAIGGPAGFFASDRLERLHPLAETFEILWSGAANIKAMQAAVRDSGMQIDSIKVRGAAIRPEKIRKKIGQAGGDDAKQIATLLIGCIGKRIYAVIGKRLTASPDGGDRMS